MARRARSSHLPMIWASLWVLLLGTPAQADSSAGDRAAADALFDDAQRLVREGKYAEACPKFVESYRLDPASGTLLNLGDCYEKNGQTASAWVAFGDSEAMSRREGNQMRAKEAERRAKIVEPWLTKLMITVPQESQIAGLAVRRDGDVLRPAQWGTPVPVDPGTHTVDATAPGKQPWSARAEVGANQGMITVSIPVLTPVPVEKPAAPVGPPTPVGLPAPVEHSMWSGQRTAAVIVGGAGVVGAVVGTVFGLQAGSQNRASRAHCLPDHQNLCDPQGVALRQETNTSANVSNVAFGLGAAALIAGGVLFFTAPSRPAAKSAVRLHLIASPLGVGLQGAW